MTRILFLGDLAATGFGTVTMDLGRALLALDEDVRFCSLNELPGELPEPFASRTALFGAADGWLGAITVERLEGMFTGGLFEDGWTPETAIIVGDVASLMVSPVTRFIPPGFPVFHYVPIEGVGLPPRWAAMWRGLQPVAMSEFGANEIAKVTGSRPPVIYHGVDTDAFYPVSDERPIVLRGEKNLTVLRSKADCRRFFGGQPKDVWLLRADRLMPRKRYPSLLRALFPVLAASPQARLVLHCRTQDQGGNLDDEISKYPQVVAKRIMLTGFAGQVDRTVLNALYNASDLYVSVSAEGFGLTIAEALACGVPAVGMAYSAVPEVIGPAGVLVPAAGLIDNEYSHFWAAVDEPAFGTAVARLVGDKFLRRRLGSLGPTHVREHFSWTTAAHQFADLVHAALPEAIAA